MGQFDDLVASMPALFERLMDCAEFPVSMPTAWRNLPGVYLLLDQGLSAYVGRTRNVTRRLRDHVTPSHRKAPFAFRRACQIFGRPAPTYRAAGGLDSIAADPNFIPIFKSQIDSVRLMTAKAVHIPDGPAQYLLELFATIELGLSTDAFKNH